MIIPAHLLQDTPSPVKQPATLDREQMERYSRQILLREIGGEGQKKLSGSTVFILGAGGLGSPVALYLAAAGIGHLIIADADQVERSNLQRQILHTTDRIGQPKATSAAASLQALNPGIAITTIPERITEQNLPDLVDASDVVVDGSDNYTTRYALNTACWTHKKRWIYGAVLGFEGQIAVFDHGPDPTTPCYRCLFSSPPEGGPTCRSAGVLGAVAGMIGTLQATETIKSLLGIGKPLVGSLLLVNVLDHLFHRVRIEKQPHCLTCGQP